MRRVVVTGLGLVTPLGVGVQHAWKRLLAGESGVVSLIGRNGDPRFAELPSTVGAVVPPGDASDGGWDASEWIEKGDDRRMANFTQYAIGAAEQALRDAEWKPTLDEQKERTGVCVGSGIGAFEDSVNATVAYVKGGYRKVSPLLVPRILINMAAGHITMKYGFRGPNHAASTACTTGAHSIGDAARFIMFGDADVMVAGGTESCIHPLAMGGFARARSLATEFNDRPAEASRPFDRDRCGFVIGEGAGAVVLEEYEHAKARGARIYGELLGYGLSADAHHMTAPPSDGSGANLSMRRALNHAKLPASQIGYINAHATSTPLGDAAENQAIKALMLGKDGKQSASEVNVSSCKGAVGHLLGAAGAVEAIFSIMALHEGVLPPTINLHNPGDPAEDFDCNYIPNQAQEKKVSAVLTNSFGFGGTNASLVFGKVDV
ncbi:Mitochondrial beta-keto-acyl synthase [Saitoella coloradoensis]